MYFRPKIAAGRSLLLAFVLSFAQIVFAQTGGIYGTITDKKTQEEVVGVIVEVFQKNVVKGGAVTDADGKYQIKPLQPGTDYEIRVRIAGFKEMRVKNVPVSPDRVTYQDFKLEESTTGLEKAIVDEYRNLGAISGTVSKAKNRAPVKNVIVDVLQRGLTKATAMTDENGKYLLTRLLPASNYEVRVRFSRSYKEIRLLNVIVTSDSVVNCDFKLEKLPRKWRK